MKRLLIGAAMVVTFAWSTMAAAETYVLKIEGMACPACAARIKQQLGRLKNVEKAQVDYASGKGMVQTKDGVLLTEEQVREVVSGAGFKLSGFKQIEEPDAEAPREGKS
jgi:copper chaperone CopZ